jgi:hypothetical protein
MRRIDHHRRMFRLSIVIMLAIALAWPASALAQATTPDAAETLPDGKMLGGWLTGNGGGAFHYYKVDYPGDGRVVTISFDFAPWDPLLGAGVGFNVYGRNGYHIGQGSGAGLSSHQVRELSYSDDVAAIWLIQVYNYVPNRTISYRIKIGGMPPAYQEVVAGALPGKSAGSFQFYTFQYAGDESDVQVKMTFSPDNPMISRGVGVVIYCPKGEAARGNGTGTPGERLAVFSSTVSGRYLIQVFNYIPGLMMSYSLSATPALTFIGDQPD